MIHGFPALIWFFPLCAMEISGYESLAVVWFSPLLVLIGPLRRAISTPLGLLVLRLLSLVGVASYQAPTLLSRLILLAVGNFFCGLVLTAKWWNMSKLDRLEAQCNSMCFGCKIRNSPGDYYVHHFRHLFSLVKFFILQFFCRIFMINQGSMFEP